jgi:hypothetical protein
MSSQQDDRRGRWVSVLAVLFDLLDGQGIEVARMSFAETN